MARRWSTSPERRSCPRPAPRCWRRPTRPRRACCRSCADRPPGRPRRGPVRTARTTATTVGGHHRIATCTARPSPQEGGDLDGRHVGRRPGQRPRHLHDHQPADADRGAPADRPEDQGHRAGQQRQRAPVGQHPACQAVRRPPRRTWPRRHLDRRPGDVVEHLGAGRQRRRAPSPARVDLHVTSVAAPAFTASSVVGKDQELVGPGGRRSRSRRATTSTEVTAAARPTSCRWRAAINAAGTGVRAAALEGRRTGQYRLQLTATTTGAAQRLRRRPAWPATTRSSGPAPTPAHRTSSGRRLTVDLGRRHLHRRAARHHLQGLDPAGRPTGDGHRRHRHAAAIAAVKALVDSVNTPLPDISSQTRPRRRRQHSTAGPLAGDSLSARSASACWPLGVAGGSPARRGRRADHPRRPAEVRRRRLRQARRHRPRRGRARWSAGVADRVKAVADGATGTVAAPSPPPSAAARTPCATSASRSTPGTAARPAPHSLERSTRRSRRPSGQAAEPVQLARGPARRPVRLRLG